jgi:hypothetical protein
MLEKDPKGKEYAMNRRSFIRTITTSGVSLFLPKIIQPMRWKRAHEGLYASDFVSGVEAFKGMSSDYLEIINKRWLFAGYDDEPFSISALSKPINLKTQS